MNKLECILLVDDDEVCNFVNENVILQVDNKLRIDKAIDGQIALDFVLNYTEECPQLILLDLNMPVMDGFEFLDEFSLLPPEKRRNIVIVVLTSSEAQYDMDRAHEYGVVTAYITKPLTLEKMVTIIESCFIEDKGSV